VQHCGAIDHNLRRNVQIRSFLIAPIVIVAAAACSGNSNDQAEVLTPKPDELPGVYAGDFPCSNCAAIAATLWLRPDGRFFLRQRYVGENGAAAGTNAYALGSWRWDESTALVVLEARGPERRLARLDVDRLALVTASAAPHVLERDPAAPPFTDSVPLDGESAIVDGNGVFKECLTGLTLPIAKQNAFDDLRRLHRRMNRSGRITLTAVEAHLTANAVTETLVLDRVLELKPGEGC
jgi:hypothetical protein